MTVTTEANADVTAPTMPTLHSATIGAAGYCPDEIWTQWTESTDGGQPASAIEYEVRVNGTIIDVAVGGTRQVSYTDVPGPITPTLVAVDRAGNASTPEQPDQREHQLGNRPGMPQLTGLFRKFFWVDHQAAGGSSTVASCCSC